MTASKDRPGIRVSILAIMIFQICALFARSILDLTLVRKGIDRSVSNDLSYLVVPPILALLLCPYLRQHKDALLGLLRVSHLTFRVAAFSIVLGLLMRLTYWALLTVLMWTGLVGNDDPDAIVGPILGFGCPPLPVLMFSLVTMSLLVPIVEEVVNRGLLLHALLNRGTIAAVIISALLFTLMHKPGSYAVAFTIGLFLAVQALNSRALWAPLLTHGAYNFAATIHWDCFQIVWNPPVLDQTLATAAYVAAPVALTGVLLCCWLVSKRAIGARTPRLPAKSA
jgi:membrane protease YdiL (CAAX protease family)